MCKKGAIANQALTLAFPIQILIIAIGVGTGIGLNALLSKSLGEKNKEKVNKVAGNGIFLSICIFIVFLLFGLFGSECFISLFVAMFFHYTKNKEINENLKYIKPDIGIIKGIYKIGISAAIMQALLSVMMAGMNAILGGAKADPTILVGSFGIYYKIQQIALFSAFGLSNTIISILSFNYGMKDKERINDCIKYGIIDTAKEHTKKKYRELFKERLFFRTIRVGSRCFQKLFFLGQFCPFPLEKVQREFCQSLWL